MPSSWRSRRRFGLELGEHAQHVQERLARGRAGVHGLLGGAQGDALRLQLVHDVLEVLQRAREAVDAGDHQRVAGLHEVEQHLQLGPPVAAGAGRRLGADHLATGRLEGGALDGEVLVESGYAGVAVGGHGCPERVWTPARYRSRMPETTLLARGNHPTPPCH